MSPSTVSSSSRPRALWTATVAVLLVVGLGLTISGSGDLTASEAMSRYVLPALDVGNYSAVEVAATTALTNVTLRDHALHPHHRFQSYFARHEPTAAVPFGTAHTQDKRLTAFHDLLDMFVTRQGVDDNFTMRFRDSRTGELLKIHTLEDARAAYRASGEADWPAIDRERRQETRRILDAMEKSGFPREHISVRWGRANQMLEARERKALVHEYEIRLARMLDLSLLVTELSTVETFNQDHLVSSAGARGRYQMMPSQLRRHNIHQYRLSAEAGRGVDVREELHPLITMEQAFKMVRSHVNAFGSEIPGISAYHTGPGNVFHVLRRFVENEPDAMVYPRNVLDGYIWALTEGFGLVSRESTFKTYSQGYVPSLYGALRATEHLPVDTSGTMRAEQVQLASGQSITLRELLEVLADAEDLDWHPAPAGASAYAGFRAMNMHFDLPAPAPGLTVPAGGNARLTATSGGHPVRFFLPIGAIAHLEAHGLHIIDRSATRAFDEHTYTLRPSEYTEWDRRYAALVESVGQFGFTEANKTRLHEIGKAFEALLEDNPSQFRQMQHYAVQTHINLWDFGAWHPRAGPTREARQRLRLPPHPPQHLDIASPSLPSALRAN